MFIQAAPTKYVRSPTLTLRWRAKRSGRTDVQREQYCSRRGVPSPDGTVGVGGKVKLTWGKSKKAFGSVERCSLSKTILRLKCPRSQIVFNKLCLLMLQNPKGLPNIIWNQRSRKSLFDCVICTYVCKCISPSQASGIHVGSTQKGCSHAADVFADFHRNLRRKTAKNFGAT